MWADSIANQITISCLYSVFTYLGTLKQSIRAILAIGVKFTESINDVFPSDKNINNPHQLSSLILIVTLTKQIPLSSVFIMDASSSNNARVIANPCSKEAAQLRREQLQSFYGLQAPNKSSICRRHDGYSIATPRRISQEMPEKGY